MNHLVMHDLKVADFDSIHDTLKTAFVICVLNCYEQNSWNKPFPIIPAGFYGSQDNEFYEDYHEAFLFLRASIERSMFDESKWNQLDEKEFEQVDEEMASYAPSYEEDLMDDIRTVLDLHQIFYVNVDYAYDDDDKETLFIEGPSNCPLQGVW